MVCVFIVSNLIGGEKKVERRVERLYSVEDARFARELGILLGPAFVAGNRITALRNGDEIFPAMLAAIRDSSTTITCETYIYWSGDIGRSFANALSERARQGVKTHVLLDWVGSAKLEQKLLDEMAAAGVQMRIFHPPHWSRLGKLNNRTHRKLLVSVGSTNFDNRSFRLNDEATLNV
ncbi:MAG: phospholipase D-like domain-containing protein, partial [Rhodoferax sp.]|nr:phospholipase D-like domain-containing protein [Rhodoferax sp.]